MSETYKRALAFLATLPAPIRNAAELVRGDEDAWVEIRLQGPEGKALCWFGDWTAQHTEDTGDVQWAEPTADQVPWLLKSVGFGTIADVFKRLETVPEYWGQELTRDDYAVLVRWLQTLSDDETTLRFGTDKKRRQVLYALECGHPVLLNNRVVRKPTLSPLAQEPQR